MAKFLFTVIPALGHINPTMAVASELKKRGHRVGYATGKDMQFPIEQEGFDYFSAGPPGVKSEISETGKKVLKYKGLIGHYFFFKLLMETNRDTIGALKNIVREYQPDVLVVDSITHAGGEVAELSRLPWATCCSVPGLIPSKDVPPFTHWGFPPSANGCVNRFYSMIRFGQKFFFGFFDRELNQLRAALGLPPLKQGVITTSLSPNLILIFTVEGFEYQRSDWPQQAHLIGPSPWGKPIDAGSSFDWIDALPEDKPVIYVTLGTFQVFRSLRFFQIVIEALKDEPYQVVMSVGPAADQEEFKQAPPHFRIERFVPHAKILPRSTAVIHHGGQGIAQDSIYHGLPSVVVPISQDLHEIARRCEVAGVSLRIPYTKLTPQRLRQALRRILEDTEMQQNTRKLQQVFLSTSAGRSGADLLEQLAREPRPVYRNQN